MTILLPDFMKSMLRNAILIILLAMLVSSCNPPSLPASLPPGIPSPSSAATAGNLPETEVPCFLTYYAPFAFLPDGERLLVRAQAGVQIFDLVNNKEQQFLIAPTNLTGPAVALSTDGTEFAWALEEGTIEWIRLADWEKITTIHSRESGPVKLEFSPAGDQLFTVSHENEVMVWDRDGNQAGWLNPGGELVNIGISPDGSLLATIPADGPVSLWRLDDLSPVRELGGTGGYDTSDIAFSPDGDYLVADLAAGLFLWDLTDGSQLLGNAQPINSMAAAYSPDGRLLAYSDLNKVIIGSSDGSQVMRSLEGHTAPVFELLFSPDGALLVSADDVEMRVWRASDGKLLAIGRSACP